MRLEGNTVVITGGSTGIGFALAERLVKLGNEVVICGRSGEKLKAAEEKLPSVHTLNADISKDEGRRRLFEFVTTKFKGANILVNNAGIQRHIDFRKGIVDLLKNEDEIEINFRSQIYLSAMFIPVLMKQKDPAIVNVSSGLGFAPLAAFPVYSATKAGIHSFTVSLRRQLRDTAIRVFEAIPPTVYDTGLKGKPIEKTEWSISSAEMADAIIEGLKNDVYEIAAGASKNFLSASKRDLDKAFGDMNRTF
jgi:uncharacterized oxidoreductase